MSSEEEVKKWACEQVSSIIGINSEECRPLIDNIWELQTESEIRTEFQNIIGNSVSTNLFINEFVSKRKLQSNSNHNSNANLEFDGRNSPFEYHKNDAEEYYSGSKKKKKEKKISDSPKKDKGKNKEKEVEKGNDTDDIDDDDEKEVKLSKRQQKKLNAKKKKGGMSLEEWDKEDRSYVTKGKNGRPLCPCQAAKHGLVANCLNCGKIVCKLEGPGPCPFCGEEVVDSEQQVRVYQQKQREKLREEKTILIKSSNSNNQEGGSSSSSSKVNASSSSSSPLRQTQEQIDQQRSEKLAIKLEVQMEMEKREKAYEKALMMRERLLDFDKNSTERTKIFDTATDFDPNMTAANNKWLTPEERLRAIKKEQALREYEKNKRKNVRIAIDLKTKQVVELPADPFEYKEDEPATASSKSKEQEEEEATGTGYYINPFIKEIPKYVKVNIYDKQKQEKEKPKSILEKKNEQKEKEKAAREKAKKEAAKAADKDKQSTESTSTTKKEKKAISKKSGKSRIRRIQYDPEDDDMYGVDFAFSDDEEETEDAGVCTTDNISRPSMVVDY